MGDTMAQGRPARAGLPIALRIAAAPSAIQALGMGLPNPRYYACSAFSEPRIAPAGESG